MKRFIHDLQNYKIKENVIFFESENGRIELSIFEEGIFHFNYIFNDILVDPLLDKWSAYLSKNDLKPSRSFEVKDFEDIYDIESDNIKIIVDKISANITVYKNNEIIHGGVLGSSDTVIPDYQLRCIGSNDKKNLFGKFNFPLESDDSFYGLGDKGGLIDRKNKSFRFFNRDSLGYDAEISDPLYKSIPFFIKEKNKNYSGFFFDECNIDFMDFGKESPYFYSIKIDGGPFSYFLIDGDDYKEVLRKYYIISGTSYFPPLFSFGFLGSSMNYVESDDAKDRILKYFETIEKFDIPCEGMYVSSGYLKANDGKRYAFMWNKDKFPNYKDYLLDLSNRGYNLIMNIKPGILTTHPWYDELAKKGYFIKDEFDKPYVEFYWGGDASLIDFSNQDAKNWWKSQLKKQYLDHGCSGIWNDNNEFEIEDVEIPNSKIKTILPILMSEAAYEAFEEQAPTKRAWNYSRSGYSGIQKYARTWSGDNCSNWKSLKYNQYQSISMALSGLTFYGHDLGGFFGERPSEELLIRSCESAVFQSRFVIHSWREDDKPTEPWTYEKALPQIRNLIIEHYKFLPYTYNSAYNAVIKGSPMDRSLKLEFNEDDNIDVADINCMFGEDILKVLVVDKGCSSTNVYLPKTTNWYSQDGKYYEGGRDVDVSTPLGNHKYFVREGSLIPTSNINKLKTAFFERVIFNVYPINEGVREGSYFEDDGSTKLELNNYNLYKYRVYKNEVEFTLTTEGVNLENREFIFKLPNKDVIKRINLNSFKKDDTIIINF
ncbi:MAG: TIM-barrel domain-containing protein [Pleomorphochaeta sp.]